MFSLVKPNTVVETVSGTVSRIGSYADGGCNWLTYEVRLEGRTERYLIAPAVNVPPESLIHLTRQGDRVEFGLVAESRNGARVGLDKTFKNHSV